MRIVLASRSPRRASLLREAGYDFIQIDPPFNDPPTPIPPTPIPPTPIPSTSIPSTSIAPAPIPLAPSPHGLIASATTTPTGMGDQGCHRVEAACALAIELADQKALSVLNNQQLLGTVFREGDVLLAADTIVLSPGGELLGQPVDVDDARGMLMELAGRTHTVITGIALYRLLADGRGCGVGFAKVQRLADQTLVTFPQMSDEVIGQLLAPSFWKGKAGGYNLAQLGHLPIRTAGDPTTVVGLPMQKLRQILPPGC